MKIINMSQATLTQTKQAAQILTDNLPNGWPTLKDAMAEIKERLIPENVMLLVLENERVIGWGGLLKPTYDGNVFELHSLGIHSHYQKQGIGQRLVQKLEDEARKQGGLTIFVGADDDEKEEGETSLSHVDLYEDLPHKLNNFEPGTHQAGFYFKIGYKIIGVMPDANGIGKPDIFLGKKLY